MFPIDSLKEYPWANENSKHGDKVTCPTCGSPGIFDDMKHNTKEGEGEGYAVFTNACWKSVDNEWAQRFGEFECHDCWLK